VAIGIAIEIGPIREKFDRDSDPDFDFEKESESRGQNRSSMTRGVLDADGFCAGAALRAALRTGPLSPPA